MEGGYLLGGVLKGELHGGVEVVHGELVDSAEEDQEGVVYESLPEDDCPDKGFLDGFFVAVQEKVGIW